MHTVTVHTMPYNISCTEANNKEAYNGQVTFLPFFFMPNLSINDS